MLPKIGTPVHFYQPGLTTRIGLTQGHGGRGIGPYHAVVINDRGATPELVVYFPGGTVQHVTDAVFEDDVPGLAAGANPAQVQAQKGYWTFPDPLAKARHVKARSAAE